MKGKNKVLQKNSKGEFTSSLESVTYLGKVHKAGSRSWKTGKISTGKVQKGGSLSGMKAMWINVQWNKISKALNTTPYGL